MGQVHIALLSQVPTPGRSQTGCTAKPLQQDHERVLQKEKWKTASGARSPTTYDPQPEFSLRG